VTEPVIESDSEYQCETCGTPVGADRVLVLTASGQVARHPDCHEFGTPMR
jgi:hypothetical protein